MTTAATMMLNAALAYAERGSVPPLRCFLFETATEGRAVCRCGWEVAVRNKKRERRER